MSSYKGGGGGVCCSLGNNRSHSMRKLPGFGSKLELRMLKCNIMKEVVFTSSLSTHITIQYFQFISFSHVGFSELIYSNNT